MMNNDNYYGISICNSLSLTENIRTTDENLFFRTAAFPLFCRHLQMFYLLTYLLTDEGEDNVLIQRMATRRRGRIVFQMNSVCLNSCLLTASRPFGPSTIPVNRSSFIFSSDFIRSSTWSGASSVSFSLFLLFLTYCYFSM